MRHPFTRFVSSYLDKIASKEVPLVYAQIRKDILRHNGVKEGERPPTFVEFVNYLMANQAMGGYVGEQVFLTGFRIVTAHNFCLE